MTNTKTINELTNIDREIKIGSEIEALEAERTKSRTERRSSTEGGDAASVRTAQQAYDKASDTVKATRASIVINESALADMNSRQEGGDRSVTSTNVREVKDEIETLKNYLGHDKKALKQAEATLRPLVADQHLADLAADLLETVTQVPVIVRRKPANAPEVSPAVILSQTQECDGYGSLDCSGSVTVTEVGDARIDWPAVQATFEDAGCEGLFTNTQLAFHVAAWPLPRLATPSVHGIGEWMHTFGQAWSLQVAGTAEAARMREAGYSVRVNSVWTGLFDRLTDDFTFEDGKAVGTSLIMVAAQQDDGTSMPLEDLRHELTELVATFRDETVGGITEAGEIVSVSVSEVKNSRRDWKSGGVAWRMGGAVQPNTAEATVTVEFAYEAA